MVTMNVSKILLVAVIMACIAMTIECHSNSSAPETNGWTPSKLVDQLHALPHYDSKLHRTSNQLRLKDHYFESLGMFAGWFVAAGLLCFLLMFGLLIVRCCCCPARPKPDDVYGEPPIACLLWIVFVVLLAGAGVIGGVYGNAMMTSGVENIVGSISDANQTLLDAENNCGKIGDSLKDVDADVTSFMTVVDNPPQQLIDDATECQTQLAEARTMVLNARTDAEKFDIQGMTHTDKMNSYDKIRSAAQYALLVLIPIPALLLLLARVRNSRGWIVPAIAVAMFFTMVGWPASGTEMAVSVALADLCIDPNAFINTQIKSKKDQDVVDYYLNCIEGDPMPFEGYIDQAKKSLDDAADQANDLIVFAQASNQSTVLVPQALAINASVWKATSHLYDLDDDLTCASVHQDYLRGLHGLCDEAVGAAFVLTVCQTIGCISVLLTVFVGVGLWKHYDPRRSPYYDQSILNRDRSSRIPHDAAHGTAPLLEPLTADSSNNSVQGEFLADPAGVRHGAQL